MTSSVWPNRKLFFFYGGFGQRLTELYSPKEDEGVLKEHSQPGGHFFLWKWAETSLKLSINLTLRLELNTDTKRWPQVGTLTLTWHHVATKQDPDGGDEGAKHHHEADKEPEASPCRTNNPLLPVSPHRHYRTINTGRSSDFTSRTDPVWTWFIILYTHNQMKSEVCRSGPAHVCCELHRPPRTWRPIREQPDRRQRQQSSLSHMMLLPHSTGLAQCHLHPVTETHLSCRGSPLHTCLLSPGR